MNHFFDKNQSTKKFVAQFLIVCLLSAGLAPVFLMPKSAQAQIPVVDPELNALQTAWKIIKTAFDKLQTAYQLVSKSVAKWFQEQDLLKKALDIAWEVLRKRLLTMITNDVINWVQGAGPGDGGPKFITNWEEFLNKSVSDATFQFVREVTNNKVNLNKFCAPFRPQIKLALGAVPDDYWNRAQCSLKDLGSNLINFSDNFVQGGGWSTMVSLTQPRNNFYGAYLTGMHELYSRQDLAFQSSISKGVSGAGSVGDERCTECHTANADGSLAWTGRGFKQCWDFEGKPDTPVGGYFQCDKLEIYTPGGILMETAAKAINVDYDYLLQSNRYGKYIAAILDAVVNRVAREGLLVMRTGRGSQPWEPKYGYYEGRGTQGTWLEELAEYFANDLSDAQILLGEQKRIKSYFQSAYGRTLAFNYPKEAFLTGGLVPFVKGAPQATKDYTEILKQILKYTHVLVQVEDEIISIIENDLNLNDLLADAREIIKEEISSGVKKISEQIFKKIPDRKVEPLRDIIRKHLTGGAICLGEYDCRPRNILGERVDPPPGKCVHPFFPFNSAWECVAGEFNPGASLINDLDTAYIGTTTTPKYIIKDKITKSLNSYGTRIMNQIVMNKSLKVLTETNIPKNLNCFRSGGIFCGFGNLSAVALLYPNNFDLEIALPIVNKHEEQILTEISDELFDITEGASFEDITSEVWTKIAGQIFGVINLEGLIANGHAFSDRQETIIELVQREKAVTLNYIKNQINQEAERIASDLTSLFNNIKNAIEKDNYVVAIRELNPNDVAGAATARAEHSPTDGIRAAINNGIDEINEYIADEGLSIITTGDIESVREALLYIVNDEATVDGLMANDENAVETINVAIDEIIQGVDWQLKDLLDAPTTPTGLRVRAQTEIEGIAPSVDIFSSIENIINNAGADTSLKTIKDQITSLFNTLIDQVRGLRIITEINIEDKPSLFEEVRDGLNDIKQRIFNSIDANASPMSDELGTIQGHITNLEGVISPFIQNFLINDIRSSGHYQLPRIPTIVADRFDKIREAVISNVSVRDLREIAHNELRGLENDIGSLERITDEDMDKLHEGLDWIMQDSWLSGDQESMARNIDRHSAIGIERSRAEIIDAINGARSYIKTKIGSAGVINADNLGPDQNAGEVLDLMGVIIDRHFDAMEEVADAEWMKLSSALKDRVASRLEKIKEGFESIEVSIPRKDQTKGFINYDTIKNALVCSAEEELFACQKEKIFEVIDNNSDPGIYYSLTIHAVETKSLIKRYAINRDMLAAGQSVDDIMSQVDLIVDEHYENMYNEIDVIFWKNIEGIKRIINNQFKEMEENIRNTGLTGLDLAAVRDILNNQRGECDGFCQWISCGPGSCTEGSVLNDVDAALVTHGLVGERMNSAYNHFLEIAKDLEGVEELGALLIQGVLQRAITILLGQVLANSSADNFLYIAEDTASVRRKMEETIGNKEEQIRSFWSGVWSRVENAIGNIFTF